MNAQHRRLGACAMHISCINDEPIAAAELLTAAPRLAARIPSARIAFLSLDPDIILPTLSAALSIAAGGIQRLAVYDQSLQLRRALPPGTLSSFTFDALTDLDWTVGLGLNVFSLRIFMDLLPLLPHLRRLSVGPDPHAPMAYLQASAHQSPVRFALPQSGYPFRLTSFTSNYVLNDATILLILTSSSNTLKRLSLQMNAFDLTTLVPHLPHMPLITDLAVLTANRLVPRAVTETLLQRCPRAERVHLRTEFDDMYEVQAVAFAGLRRLRALKLSSLHDFSSDNAPKWMVEWLRASKSSIRRIDVVAPYFERAVLERFRAECASMRIVLKEHAMRQHNDLLTL